MHVVSVEVTVDGKDLDAVVPSGIIKVVRPMTIVAGETTVAAFDFDAQKSVVVTGSDRVLFKPVIKLLVRKGTEPFRPSVSTPEAQSPPTPPSVPQAAATPEPESTATATVTPPTTPAPSTEAEEPEATGPGTVEILVTDPSPPDIEHYMVTLSSVEVHKANAGEGSPWITIFDDEKTFDLIDLAVIEEFLAAAIVESGKYTQIRMHVASVTLTLAGGEEVSAKVPGEKIRIVRPFNVVANETTVLLFDCDGEKSIVSTGAGKFIFKPVIKLSVPKEGGVDNAQDGDADDANDGDNDI